MQPIVFDLLDTLLDESGVYKKFYSYVSKKYFINLESQEFINLFFQYQQENIFMNSKKPFKELIRLAYLKLVKNGNVRDLEILFQLHKDMVFLPGVKEVLTRLQNKFRFFVLTNCDNDLIKKIDLPSKSHIKFEKIFTSEDNHVYKPNPASYQKVVDYLKLPANEIIYISSNKWDLNASKEFGFNSKSIEELKSIS